MCVIHYDVYRCIYIAEPRSESPGGYPIPDISDSLGPARFTQVTQFVGRLGFLESGKMYGFFCLTDHRLSNTEFSSEMMCQQVQ